MSDETITLNPSQSLALRKMIEAMKADDGLFSACPEVVRSALADFYMPPWSSAEKQIADLQKWGEGNLRLAERFGNKVRELEAKPKRTSLSGAQASALRIIGERLAPQHLIKCGITSRRSEAEHIIAMVKEAAATLREKAA